MKKTVKYKTHPIYKALTWLMLTITVAALLFAWAVYVSAGTKERMYGSAMESCGYEAYLSFCEKLGVIAESDDGTETAYASVAAGEALSRYVLFSDIETDADALRGLLMSGQVGKEEAEELLRVLSEGGTRDEAVSAAIKTALEWGKDPTISSERDSGGWRWLSSLPEVKETEASKTAARFIGGGGKVRRGESHTFPLVYSYVNGNASAEVTRMGGRLIRMYKFPIGSAEKRTVEQCALSAERFLRDAGIKDAELYSAELVGDVAELKFAPPSETEESARSISVNVALSGATVIYFDAYEYYRNR